jgi:hypothetical protein
MARLRGGEAAYLAGFFDGEGCVGAGETNGRVVASIQITQKAPDVLRELQELTGLGHITQMRRPPRELWAWRMYARSDVEAFGRLVMPWTKIKRDQLALAVELTQVQSSSPRAFEIRSLLTRSHGRPV